MTSLSTRTSWNSMIVRRQRPNIVIDSLKRGFQVARTKEKVMIEAAKTDSWVSFRRRRKS
jgi:hypothetical protein